MHFAGWNEATSACELMMEDTEPLEYQANLCINKTTAHAVARPKGQILNESRSVVHL